MKSSKKSTERRPAARRPRPAGEPLPQVGRYLDELAACLQQFRSQAENLQCAAALIAQAKGIFALGVGKSGYLAQKLAASLRSISRPADFVHAGEALHGDLGRFRQGDLAIIISKSGASDELKTILPLLQKRGVRLIAITNRPASLAGSLAEITIHTGVRSEGDRFDLLPLISTDVSLVAANILVSLTAEISGLTPATFREAHPGGQLGFAVGLTLNDLTAWKSRRPAIPAATKVLEATLVMSKFRAGIVCVTGRSEKLLGILSDGDLRKLVAGGVDLQQANVSDWMNTQPKTLAASMSVADALVEMESGERKIFAAPVLDKRGGCLGVVTIHDLVR